MKKLTGIILVTIFAGCSSVKQLQATSLSGTWWKYTDADWSYEIEFEPEGRLESTHPNENVMNKDIWTQSGKIVSFSFNDRFSKYRGTIVSEDLITGKARSSSGRWRWKMIRIR